MKKGSENAPFLKLEKWNFASNANLSRYLNLIFYILEPNSLDWNVNELEYKLELEDMKPTNVIWHTAVNKKTLLQRLIISKL